MTSAALAAPPIEDRVEAQRAIERVYAAHRVGGDGEGVPESVIRDKVGRFLRESAALESMWNTRIDAAAIERELDRMAKQSLRRDILSDLFRALDSDPAKVAEYLIRPIVADRLARTSYAWDPRIHGALRRQAEQSLRVSKSLDALSRMAPRWETREVDADSDDARLVAKVEETEGSFVVRGVVSRDGAKVVVGTATWVKEPFESWLDRTQAAEPPEPLGAAPALPALSPGCTPNTWSALPSVPDPMSDALYAWTGTRLIVWSPFLRSGGLYDPATDEWTLMNPAGTTQRSFATAIWTGSQFVVWGGRDDNAGGTYFATGERYDPQTDTWSPTSTTNAPTARYGHVAVWTGTRMIVWGGFGSTGLLTSGASYDPQTDTWTAISSTNAPTGRSQTTAVWDGSRLIVWGGSSAGGTQPLATGGRYNPSTDTWTSTSTVGAPSARRFHTAVWTGTEMIVWGGQELSNLVNTGARYNPVTDTWTPTTTSGAISGRYLHRAVWSGGEMIIWGGFTYGGGRYNPATDSWIPMAQPVIPTIGHRAHAMVWSGSKAIVWGGIEANVLNTGGRYDPALNSWTPTRTYGEPSARGGAKLVWTGTELLVWGGFGRSTEPPPLESSKLDLATTTWSPISTVNAPSARSNHTFVWTGKKAIVWGGTSDASGGVYDPVSNTWTMTSQFGAPSARSTHGAVWTGKWMMIWGGEQSGTASSPETGALYDAVTNQWTPVSTVNAPTRRSGSMLVWTGSRAIAWAPNANPGGMFDPETNTWTTMSMVGQPANAGVSTWTGNRMLAWNGLGPGGRFDPVTNSWSPMSTVGSPTSGTALVWTGDKAFAWSDAGTGAYYDPAADSWSSVPTFRAPSPRSYYPATWVGTFITLWGGVLPSFNYYNTGASLCQACAVTYNYYRDADGDRDGVPGESIQGCSAIAPFGWSTTTTDCNDANPAMYSGAPETCDGLNDNCSDPNWPAVPANEANADNDGYRICAGDCNDSNPNVFPGHAQLCDGINNNCLDPSWPNPPANEADADGDGSRICAGDCDDTNRAIRPGWVEVCDGLDNDCSGQFDDDADGVDIDADGVRNVCDNCAYLANASQVDADADTIGDACDNCASIPNDAQSDRNADGQGDICDLDDGVIYLFTTNRNQVEWQQEAGPTSFNVYEGDLGELRLSGEYSQAPGSNPLAQRTCSVAGTSIGDVEAVTPGHVKFAIVTGLTGGFEGTMGTNSAGTPRSNTHPCP
ncbi:MAG TPA: MopE-related protein [Candidatus Polarisedimenticolaceae bacterium]|nr:MopE-related protein [Candidatus Polarisedimenticolaceae bacterium]